MKIKLIDARKSPKRSEEVGLSEADLKRIRAELAALKKKGQPDGR